MADASSLHSMFFTAPGLEPGVARVLRVAAHEAMSLSYQLEVDLELGVTAMDPSSLVGGPGLAVVLGPDGVVLRRFSGLITRSRERASRGTKHHFSLTLESPLARLRWVSDCRIFQEQTTQEIVAALLEERGISGAGVSFRLTGSYPKREVCTQLGEDTFTFVSRILEEDGIFYFHEHGEDGPVVVFGDADSAYAETGPSAQVPWRAASGLVSGGRSSSSPPWRARAPPA